MSKIDSTLRKIVYERDNLLCQVCLKKVILTKDIRTEEDYKLEASLDHIIPISNKGKTREENLRTICRSCNSIKGDRENPSEIKFLSLNKGEFTRIANAIISALSRTKLNSEESRVLFAIISKTYGFQHSEDWVSNSQLEELTKIHRSHCSRTVTRLRKRNIVTKTGNKIKLNKYFFNWISLLPKQATVTKTGNKDKLPKQATNVARTGTEVLPKQAYTKETIKDKRNYSKTSTKFLQGEQWNELIDPFEKVNPMFRNFYKNKTERRALQEMVDEMGYLKVKWLIDNLRQAVSKPYAPKISKPTELKRDLGKLIIFWEQEKVKNIKSNSKIGKI